MEQSEEFFERLEQKSGIKISKEQREAIRARLTAITTYEPTIGVFGKTGAGKSSLCNALFGKDVCSVSDIAACTREPQEVLLQLGEKGIKLLDVPGVGESEDRDIEYGKLYNSLLPKLDLVLWVLKGDDRAYATDAMFYEKVVKPHVDEGKLPFFFVVNQVDKIEPFREWDEKEHKPGLKQASNIEHKVQMVAESFKYPKSHVVPVSAHEKYNLVTLIDTIAYELPKEKRMGFAREVNEELHSSAFKSWIKASWGDNIKDAVFEATGNELLASGCGIVADIAELAVDVVTAPIKGVIKIGKKVFGWLFG
jgi:small GTP-binding protein